MVVRGKQRRGKVGWKQLALSTTEEHSICVVFQAQCR